MKDESPKNRICVAKVATAHGIKGLVKLHVFVDNVELIKGALFTDETSDTTLSVKLKNATAKHWLAEIDDISDRTDAEKLRGTNLYINQDSLPTPDEDEVYIKDLMGLMCVDNKGADIGKIIAFENFGAGDLIEIQPASTLETMESFYLPFNDDTILEISDTCVQVSIPEGLI